MADQVTIEVDRGIGENPWFYVLRIPGVCDITSDSSYCSRDFALLAGVKRAEIELSIRYKAS